MCTFIRYLVHFTPLTGAPTCFTLTNITPTKQGSRRPRPSVLVPLRSYECPPAQSFALFSVLVSWTQHTATGNQRPNLRISTRFPSWIMPSIIHQNSARFGVLEFLSSQPHCLRDPTALLCVTRSSWHALHFASCFAAYLATGMPNRWSSLRSTSQTPATRCDGRV